MNKLWKNVLAYLSNSSATEFVIVDTKGNKYALLGCGSSSEKPGVVTISIKETV